MTEIEPEAPAPEATPEQVEPEWTGPSRSEWEETQAQLSQYAELIQQQQQPQQEQGAPPIPDPWADDYQEQVAAREAWLLAPYQQFQQQIQQRESREAVMENFDRLAASGGQFDKDMAWKVARELYAESGPPRNDHESDQLLAKAAQLVREYEKRVGEAYHQQQLEQMQTIAGGQRRLPASSQGAQTVPAGGYGNVPNSVEDRFFGGS